MHATTRLRRIWLRSYAFPAQCRLSNCARLRSVKLWTDWTVQFSALTIVMFRGRLLSNQTSSQRLPVGRVCPSSTASFPSCVAVRNRNWSAVSVYVACTDHRRDLSITYWRDFRDCTRKFNFPGGCSFASFCVPPRLTFVFMEIESWCKRGVQKSWGRWRNFYSKRIWLGGKTRVASGYFSYLCLYFACV